MPQIPSAKEWMYAFNKIYDPGYSRSLRLHRLRNEAKLSITQETAKALFEKLQQEPIGPPLPPYPSKMKDMWPPRGHMDLDGKWHRREILPPMICLPDFSADVGHAE